MRKIDAEMFLEIMRKNTDFELVKTPLGTCVKMDWVDAFCFAYMTSAQYLSDATMPTPVGHSLLQLTNEVLTFNISGGSVFDGERVIHSPLKWNAGQEKYMFRGTKYIFPQVISVDKEESEIRQEWINQVENPTDYIWLNMGGNMEMVLEYIVGYHYKKNGWVVDSQWTLGHSKGIPDFIAFKDDGIEEGYFLIELLLECVGHSVVNVHQNIVRNIVGEAKIGTNKFEPQLDKYLKTGYFNKGIGLLPQKKELNRTDIGLAYLDEDCNLVVNDIDCVDKKGTSQDSLFTWIEDLQICYQLLNGKDADVLEYIRSQKH